jgi:hypothetical protein
MRTRTIHAFAIAVLAAAAAPGAAPEENRRAQTMSLIDADQKPAVEKSLRELTSMSPAEAATTNKAVVTLVGNQHSIAVTRGFNVVQDEPASVAGGARGPTPTDYFMAALGTGGRAPHAPRLPDLRHVAQGDGTNGSAHRQWTASAALSALRPTPGPSEGPRRRADSTV